VKKIRLGDTEVLAALEWSAIRSPSPAGMPEVSEKKALASFLSSNKGSSRGVVVSVNGYTVVGRPEKKAKVPPKVPSAAALLALANQKETNAQDDATEGTGEEHNWIMVEQIEGKVDGFDGIGEPLFWLGMARNGLPVPGADLVVTRQQAIDELGEMLASTSGTTVFTTDRDIRYNVVGQVSVVDKKFEDVLRSAGVDRSKAQIKLFSTAGIIAIALVVVTVIALLGWFSWSSWSKAVAERKAAERASKDAASKKKKVAEETAKYEKEVRKALEDGLSKGMVEVKDALSASSPYDMIESWRQIIYGVSVYQSSWDLTGVSCTVDVNVPVCTVALARGDLGTNRALLTERPDAIIEGDRASYILRGAEVPNREINLPFLLSSLAFSKGLISDLQVLRMSGLAHTAAASKEITKSVNLPEAPALIPTPNIPAGPADAKKRPAKAKGGAGAPKSVTIQLGIAKGEISIKGDQIWQVSGVARYLDLPNVRVSGLSVQVPKDSATGMNWELSLDYMVRTLPAPVIPAVPVGEGKLQIEVPEEYKSKVAVTGGMEETSGVSTAAAEVPGDEAADAGTPTANPAP